MTITKAKDLRDNGQFHNIPENLPGWYRWWAKESEVKTLLNSIFLSKEYFNYLSKFILKGTGELEKYFCIYIGIASKGSIRARLNWHINQEHSLSNIKSGFLSTFRQTISSLISGYQTDENNTNKFLDKLTVEYYSINLRVKDKDAKKSLKIIEEDNLKNNIIPLNIQGNNRIELQEFIKDLKKARRSAKEKALKEGI